MKRLVFLLTILTSLTVDASFPEFFGSSVLNTGIGGQGSHSANNAGNNYYYPSILAWSKDINISTAVSMVTHSFNDITNVVIENPTNIYPSATTYGSVSTEYESVQTASINVALPVKTYGTFALSLFLPIGSIMETNSGDAYLPEYVLYRARYKRIMSHANYAFKITDDLAMSVGMHMGFQAGANIHTNASLNGTAYGSSATAKTEADPAIAGILSAAYRMGSTQFTATYQQELKNNLQSVATGLTAITPVAFDITIDTMIYYDPHIFRLGYQSKAWFGEWALSAEYQIWDGYKTPIVRITRNSGTIQASDNYESVQVSNILVPRAGMKFYLTDGFNLTVGAKYKPSIFSHSFNGAGNSLDLASITVSSGMGYNMNLFGTPMEIGGAVQHHMLQEETIVKTDLLENGSAGSKIGAPGFTAGGSITVFSLGVNVKL
jgi:hypothetical protein